MPKRVQNGMRGSKGIRYLVMTCSDGGDESCGHVLARHRKLRNAKRSVRVLWKRGRLRGQKPEHYIWDLKNESKVG